MLRDQTRTGCEITRQRICRRQAQKSRRTPDRERLQLNLIDERNEMQIVRFSSLGRRPQNFLHRSPICRQLGVVRMRNATTVGSVLITQDERCSRVA